MMELNDIISKMIELTSTKNSKVCTINVSDMEAYRKVQDIMKRKYDTSMSTFVTNCCKLLIQIEDTLEGKVEMKNESSNPLDNIPTEFTGNHENLELWKKWYKSLTKAQYLEYDRTIFTPQWKARHDKDDPTWKQRLILHNQVFEQELWYEEVFAND